MCPRGSWKRRAIWSVLVRTRAWTGCVTVTGCRSSVCATGAPLPTSSWTIVRRKWLGEQRFEFAAEQLHVRYLPPHRRPRRCSRSSSSSVRSARSPSRARGRELVARLRCLRGVDTLTALALAAEIGDFNRFKTAEEFMAFVGLVPVGALLREQRRQGSITKVGNSHVRRLLVESAWHARRHPKVGYELARRQRGHDPAVIERSWRCQQRLYQRWQRMAGRGKPHQKIVVACARELAGFVWAIATDQPLRTPDLSRPSLSASSSGCVRPHGEPS